MTGPAGKPPSTGATGGCVLMSENGLDGVRLAGETEVPETGAAGSNRGGTGTAATGSGFPGAMNSFSADVSGGITGGTGDPGAAVSGIAMAGTITCTRQAGQVPFLPDASSGTAIETEHWGQLNAMAMVWL